MLTREERNKHIPPRWLALFCIQCIIHSRPGPRRARTRRMTTVVVVVAVANSHFHFSKQQRAAFRALYRRCYKFASCSPINRLSIRNNTCIHSNQRRLFTWSTPRPSSRRGRGVFVYKLFLSFFFPPNLSNSKISAVAIWCSNKPLDLNSICLCFLFSFFLQKSARMLWNCARWLLRSNSARIEDTRYHTECTVRFHRAQRMICTRGPSTGRLWQLSIYFWHIFKRFISCHFRDLPISFTHTRYHQRYNFMGLTRLFSVWVLLVILLCRYFLIEHEGLERSCHEQ